MKKSKVKGHKRKNSKGVKSHMRIDKGAESKAGAGKEITEKLFDMKKNLSKGKRTYTPPLPKRGQRSAASKLKKKGGRTNKFVSEE